MSVSHPFSPNARRSESLGKRGAASASFKLRDTRNGYGWVSISLHWLSAAIVLALWVIGSSIEAAGASQVRVMQLHTSIAACAWLLLWWRIIRRFPLGHPGPSQGQHARFFLLGKVVHYSVLIALALMLVSGPLMVWSRGSDIHIFTQTISAPFKSNEWLASAMYQLHSWCARIIAIATALHIAGVFKHLAINRDGTFDRMMVAAEPEERRSHDERAMAPRA